MNARIKNDPYHGWRLYWQGCPDPFRRTRMMYRGKRKQGCSRRVSLAVALCTVWGSMAAFRYATRRGYPSPLSRVKAEIPDSDGGIE
jgi:hypothetical protein